MASERHGLAEVAGVFLKLGAIGFGGPAAHIALMRDEVVRRRRWVDDRQFLDLIGAANLAPGPTSTELAIHLGARRAGWRGLMVAGVCFIVPAFLIVLAIAWLYERHGTDPAVVDLRYGILPIVIAVITQALWTLGRVAIKGVMPAVVVAGVAALFVVDVNPLLLLVTGALVVMLWENRTRLQPWAGSIAPFLLALGGAGAAVSAPLWRIFLVFLKIGSITFGSGYVLVAFLERDVVHTYGWLTNAQLLDAVAIGQVTPGPVFTTATFVGYQVEGFAGAVVATLGIFLPSFVFVALLAPIVPRLRRSPWAGAALDGLNAASLGLMAGVTLVLLDDAFPDALTIAVGVVALLVLLRWRVNPAWLIGAGAVVGLARLALT
ncbi:MAG: chromate efflux transporter [Actinobacteria bacterium]|nr:chromate efflux transporter [Actinomycetota bacterium]